jgi:hypothetical protein
VGLGTSLDAVVERKIPIPLRESNLRTPIVQPVAQSFTSELSQEIWYIRVKLIVIFMDISFVLHLSSTLNLTKYKYWLLLSKK